MTQNAVQYEDDFYAWTVEQARLLRAGELSAVDAANLAEEIESVGRSDRRELQSRLAALIMHLLKWPATGGAFAGLVGDDRGATAADRASLRQLAEPAAFGQRPAAAGLQGRPRPCDQPDRPRRRRVLANLPLLSTKSCRARFRRSRDDASAALANRLANFHGLKKRHHGADHPAKCCVSQRNVSSGASSGT